jgi:hypothetical protein
MKFLKFDFEFKTGIRATVIDNEIFLSLDDLNVICKENDIKSGTEVLVEKEGLDFIFLISESELFKNYEQWKDIEGLDKEITEVILPTMRRVGMYANYVTAPFEDEVVTDYKNNTFYFESGKKYDIGYAIYLDEFCPEGVNNNLIEMFNNGIKEDLVELVGSKVSMVEELLITFPVKVVDFEEDWVKVKCNNKEKLSSFTKVKFDNKSTNVKYDDLVVGNTLYITINRDGAVKKIKKEMV